MLKHYKKIKKYYSPPLYAPQQMTTLISLPLEPTLSILKQAIESPTFDYHIPIEIENISIKMSPRLRCLILNQSCVNCHLSGNNWRIEQHTKIEDKSKWHLNLYCHDPLQGKHNILMTRDHIIALANKGPNTLKNSQTMCTHCNNKKSAKQNVTDLQPSQSIDFIPTIEEVILLAKMLEQAVVKNKLEKNKPIDENIINSSRVEQELKNNQINLGFQRILSEIFKLNPRKIIKIKHVCQQKFSNLSSLTNLNIVPKTAILWRQQIQK